MLPLLRFNLLKIDLHRCHRTTAIVDFTGSYRRIFPYVGHSFRPDELHIKRGTVHFGGYGVLFGLE